MNSYSPAAQDPGSAVAASPGRPMPAALNPLSDFFRYHGIWAPGVRLFRAVGFRAKAATIALTFLIPVVVLAWQYLSDKAEAISFSTKERVGIVYARETMPLLRLLQRQRMLATLNAATGSPSPALLELQAAIGAQTARLADVEKVHGAELGTSASFARWLQSRQSLAGRAGDADAVFGAHSASIQLLLDLLGTSTDGSNLTLDPDIDTYYLMDASMASLPSMIESVAQLRGQGAAVLARSAVTPEETRLLIEQAVSTRLKGAALEGDLDKAISSNKDLAEPVQRQTMQRDLKAFMALLESTVLLRGGPHGDTAQHIAAGNLAVDAMFGLTERVTSELDVLLAARVSRLETSRNITVAAIVVSLMVASYLFVAFRKVLDGGLREVAFHIDSMRDGDLTTSPCAWGNDEVAGLMRALVEMQDALRRIVSQVRGAAQNIVVSSTEISSGAYDLSARTEQSAANLEQSAAAMEQISATVTQTAGSANEASNLAAQSAHIAADGGEIIGTMVATMQEINGSSRRIADIIGTIDGIAFQTNMLALNAAVEAARAGPAGRGFAVVAAEVRSLSHRTTDAAREIKSLITTSVEQIASGSDVVDRAGSTMAEIVAGSKRVNAMLAEIATSAREQAQGVAQTSSAVSELDSVTQQNAALVEQTAAAANSLQAQAKALAAEVAQFQLPSAA